MSSTQMSGEPAVVPSAGTVETKIEVVVIPVSDVDRAKAFIRGWDGASTPILPPAMTGEWCS
jgi:hypothetical protein